MLINKLASIKDIQTIIEIVLHTEFVQIQNLSYTQNVLAEKTTKFSNYFARQKCVKKSAKFLKNSV